MAKVSAAHAHADDDASENLPAVQDRPLLAGQTAKLASGFRVTAKRSVTRPVLRQSADGTPVFVLIDGPIYEGQELTGQTRQGEPKMAPARLAPVIDLSTGEEMVLIANTVLENELIRNYPGPFIARLLAEKTPLNEAIAEYYSALAAGEVEAEDQPTYVGKAFSIASMMAQPPRRYRTYNIKELEVSRD